MNNHEKNNHDNNNNSNNNDKEHCGNCKCHQKKTPTISCTKPTPYQVTNLTNLRNSNNEPLDTYPNMFLCRCGLSNNKPYCDGSHSTNGIDGEKHPDRIKDKLRHYKGKNITIHDNRGVCSHDRACVTCLPSVFQKERRRWIDPDAASPEDIKNTIKKCPSGALTYTHNTEHWTGDNSEPTIRVTQNGPLEVTGNITLKDDQNSTPQCPSHYTLCRCGHSKNKPFCDGTHHDTEFSDPQN